MKSLSRRAAAFVSAIEPLESRIAPARIIDVGAPDFPTKADFNYVETPGSEFFPSPFVDTSTSNDAISNAVNPNHTANNTYYLRLSAGDHLRLQNSTNNFEDLLVVNSGNIVAFFIDQQAAGVAGHNEVNTGELVSLSLGAGADVYLKSGLAGDVVTNLNEHGTKDLSDDTLDTTDLVSGLQSIKGLVIGGGGIGGNVLSGGSVSNVIANGDIQSILTGSAAKNVSYDFYPGVAGGEGTLSGTNGSSGVNPAPGKDAGSITGITLSANLIGKIQTGVGGAGAKGGSVSQIVLSNDTDGFVIQAGDGGAGDAAKKNGGAGGAVNGVYVAGQVDPSNNSLIQIGAGAGGTSTVGGNGGIGGIATNINVGYKLVGNELIASVLPLKDDVSISSGAGGAGKSGGAAGAISKINVLLQTPNGQNDEVSLLAGTGGDSNFAGGGKIGAGGSISTVDLRNLAFTTGGGTLDGVSASMVLTAGSAGSAMGASTPANGGSITDATLLGSDFTLTAGDGSSGKTKGGLGGSVTKISVIEGDSVIAHNASFAAGKGGGASKGTGGAGGALNGIVIDDGDFQTLNFNSNNGGDGGTGTGGKGGAGGTVANVDITDIDSSAGYAGTFNLRSGNGGDGTKGGGNGGTVNVTKFDAEDLSVVVSSGVGGNVLAGGSGSGGLGGLLTDLEIASDGTQTGGADVTASVTTGIGGAGVGKVGKGGQGGDVKVASVSVPGDASIVSGAGGDGDGGAAGRGGNLTSAVAFATNGSGTIQAGNAGTAGAKAALGGTILGGSADELSGAYGFNDVTIIAGDGSNGGAGGSIKLVGYGSTSASLTPTPSGNITVQSGNGSAAGKIAGAGGAITNLTGSVSSGAATLIKAGNGGGNATVEAAGGSISDIGISRGGGAGTVFSIEAGDAGTGSTTVTKGAVGGSVSDVQISNIDPATLIRHISAGDGGSAGKTGGIGGSILRVNAPGLDIGVRSGQSFGYATMGGLFAGAGGVSALGATGKGVAGSVTFVTAGSIAAIVAGKGNAPEEVNIVDFITIGTPTDLLKASDGDLDANEAADPSDPNNEYHAFTANYATNNLVGAVMDPTAMNANRFHYTDNPGAPNGRFDLGETPIDGLILAKVFKQENSNFTPEASMIGGVFYDYDNLV